LSHEGRFLYSDVSSQPTMTSSPTLRMSVWLVPIILVVCALMILPAGAVLSGASASSIHPASVAPPSRTPTASPAVPSGSNGNVPGLPSTASSSLLQKYAHSSSSISLGSATSAQQYAQALSQVASKPGFSDSGPISALAADIKAGKVSPSSVYLPNLNLLESGPRTPGENVGSGYASNPAPMGIGDFGLGATPYAYNTSHFEGSLTLNSLNGSAPGAYYFTSPPAATGGSYNSPYYVGIQLNTVTSNISTPGNNQTSLWTQNVVTLNGNWVQFEDNVWNFSNSNLNEGTILSGNGTGVYPTFYYDYGPAVPLTFPVTIDLYNNVSVVNHNDQVTFGYRVVDSAGAFQGVYDTVVFNNTWAPLDPEFSPAFQVSGKYTTPLGLDYDSELVFGGPGGGSSATLSAINGTESLEYSNQSSGGWKNVPSAYDFGTDTGETAIGVAEVYTPAGTVGLSAGPSLLYGMWNSQPSVRAASGSIQLQGTLTPDWGFVFAGDGGGFWNQSYVPTSATGGFDTYLPPVNGVFPNGGTYYVFGVADGFGRVVKSFTSSDTGVALNPTSDPGQSTEPLYVNGNAQAESAASTLMGWTTGPLMFNGLTLLAGNDLGFDDVLFFNHLNDWGYVSFNLFQATAVTDTINVSDVYQGDSVGIDNIYFMDGAAIGSPPTVLGLPPVATGSIELYGELFAFYSDPHVLVSNEELLGYFGGSNLTATPNPYYNLDLAGGAIVLWNSPGASIQDVLAVHGSYGVWAAASPDLTFNEGLGAQGANALSLVDSNDATVTNVTGIESLVWQNSEGIADQVPFGIYDDDSAGGTFTNILGVDGGVGFADFGGSGAVVNDLQSGGASDNISGLFDFSFGALLNGAVHTSINNTTAYDEGIGVADGPYGFGSLGTTITNLSAQGSGGLAVSVDLEGSDWTNITNTLINDTEIGGALDFAQNTTFEATTIVEADVGLEGDYLANTTFVNTNISDVDDGMVLDDVYATTYTNLNTTSPVFDEAGAWLENAYDTVLTNIIGYGAPAVYLDGGATVTGTDINGTDEIFGPAVILQDGAGATFTDVMGSDLSIGLGLDNFDNTTVTTVMTTVDSDGVIIEDSNGDSVTGVTATASSIGVDIIDSYSISVTTVSASTDSIGVEVEESHNVTVQGVTVSDPSIGVYVDDSSYDSVSQVTASNQSIGVKVDDGDWNTVSSVTVSNMSVAVFSVDSEWTTVSGVTATNTTLSSPWSDGLWDGLPAVAAVVTQDDGIDAISNVQATTYPAAFYDIDSFDPGVDSVNATSSTYALVLNGTYDGVFTNIGAYMDWAGIVMNSDADDNVITQSSFVDSTSYGVAIYSGEDNIVYENNFLANNGATSTYSSAHIQALGEEFNWFDGEDLGTYTGNYWSDWHSYNSEGVLAPYPLGYENWDYYPLGGPEGTVAVYFYESGLASGVSWSVTFNGATESTPNTWLVFYAVPGTYSFTVPSVVGYSESPSSGSVSASGTSVSEYLTYTAQYNVTATETGLPSGTTWSVTVGGITATGTTSTLSVAIGSGTYPYQITPVPGYRASPSSGTLTVVNGAYNLIVTFTQVTYAVTLTESGLASGTSWSATVNGNTQSSVGTSMTFYLPNGTATFSIANVSGYSLSSYSVTLTVAGSPAGASLTFTPNTTTSLVSSDTFNTWLAVAIAVAVIALVIALLAVLMRRRRDGQQPPQGAQPWTPPPAEGAAGAPPAAASGSWSEGPPAGGSPPS